MIKISNPVTHEELISVLQYNIHTGIFTWLETRPGCKCGDAAGSVDTTGYLRIGLGGNRYTAGRLALFYFNKIWPINDVDHIDRNKLNNSISNLREVSKSTNMHNIDRKPGMSNFPNVRQSGNKWQARVMIDTKRKTLGTFNTPELAYAAVLEFKKTLK